MTETLLSTLHDTGVLRVVLHDEPPLRSETCTDGSGARLSLGASGRPVSLSVDDLVDPEEDREVHFPSLTVSIRWRDEELLLLGSPGRGTVDPWWDSPPLRRRA